MLGGQGEARLGARPRRVRAVAAIAVVAATLAAASMGRSRAAMRVSDTQQMFSTSTSYCYSDAPKPLGDCWENRPKTKTPCTVDSGEETCFCPPANGSWSCHIDMLDVGTTGRCAELQVYIDKGATHESNGEIDITGEGEETYCNSMIKNDRWSDLGVVKASSDPPASSDANWLSCLFAGGYSWSYSDSACVRKTRFLGETCWGGWFGAGACAQGSSESYDEYSTACYEGKCMPFAWVRDREQCQCAWLGWNLIVACSAHACDGHACVLNAGDGNKYCDYATKQNW